MGTIAALGAAFWAGYSAVTARNFGGWDEWLVVSLTSRGVVSFPYAHRPLALLWALPGSLGLPWTLEGYWLAQGAYILLIGLVVVALARRICPSEPAFAVVAGAVALTWAPLDIHRLNPLNNLMYSGATCAAVVALWALVRWACGGRGAWLGAAVVAALAASRSYEGTLGLLAGGGAVLLATLRSQLRVPMRRAAAIWGLTVGAAGALAALPQLLGGPSYQVEALGMDARPLAVASRLLGQLRWHVAPLFDRPPASMLSGRALLALASFAAAVACATAGSTGLFDRRRLAGAGAAGLLLASTGWGLMLLTPALSGPERMQGFSAPGVGLLIGSLVCLAASVLPARWRVAAVALLGGFVVAAGTARTLDMQGRWSAVSMYPEQARLLRELTRAVPQVDSPALVILLDDEGVFPATFTFRHAVEYLYERRVLGLVPGGYDFLYPTRFDADGVTSEPWPVIRGPWDDPVRRFPFETTLVVRARGDSLTLLDSWPSPPLPTPPDGASYGPSALVGRGARPPRAGLVED